MYLIQELGSQKWIEKKERIYEERRRNVREVCRHYDNGKRWKNETQGDKFYFDLKNGLAMCTNAKVWKKDNAEEQSVWLSKKVSKSREKFLPTMPWSKDSWLRRCFCQSLGA